MVSILGWNRVPQFGHPLELPHNMLSGHQHMNILLHYPKLWLSYIAVCRKKHGLPFDGLHAIARHKTGSSVSSAVSSLNQDILLTLAINVEESSFTLAAENAYKSPSVEPSVELLTESTSLKPHSSRRRLFPSNGCNDSLSGSDHYLLLNNGNYTIQDINDPPPTVVMCLECLELTGSQLTKCLKHVSSVGEEDIISLLKALSSYGFRRSDIKAMFVKYPPLVKVQGLEALQWFQYFTGFGFQKNVVTSLLIKRPALIACDLKRAGQVLDFFVSIGSSKEDLSDMIVCRPHVIEHDVEVVERIVTSLMKASLVKSDIYRLIKKAPTVFTVSLDNVEKSLLFWSEVGVEGKALCRAILRRPNLLNYSTESMRNTYRYLQLRTKPADLNKLVFRFAEILSYDPRTKLKPLIDYFLELGLNEEEVGRVIYRRPQIMSCTVERLKKVTDFLLGLGLKDHVVGKVLIASPQIFTLNAEKKLQRGVEFFQSVGLNRERDMEYVFVRCAQLFCCSIERNLLPTFEFLSNIGLEKESLAKMIAAFPSMLGHNAELSLAPKYEFLIGDMKRTNKELVEFPQYFGYSLEGRIIPRHKLLAERGLSKSLPSMLACTNNVFYKRYVEPYSPLPQESAGAAAQQSHPKEKPKGKKVVTLPPVHQSKPTQLELSPSPVEGQQLEPIQQKTLSENHGSEVLAVESLSVDHGSEVPAVESLSVGPGSEVPPVESLSCDSWDFLDMIPKFHELEGQLYPAYFRKLFKNPTPCGKWIHAYKSDM